MAVRPDQVASGVTFLQHPKAKESSLSQRLAFLEEKGLTPAEVTEALRVVQEASDGAAPPYEQEPEPPVMYTRVGAAGIAAAAAVIGFVARSLASDDLDGPAAGAGSAAGGVQVSGGGLEGFRATLDLWAAVLERLGLGGGAPRGKHARG
jgi:hypothetical protein